MSSDPKKITQQAMQTYEAHPGEYYIALNEEKTACEAKKIDAQTPKELDERLVSIQRGAIVTNVAIRSLPIEPDNKDKFRDRRTMYMLIMAHMQDAPEPTQTFTPKTPTTRQSSVHTPSTLDTSADDFEILKVSEVSTDAPPAPYNSSSSSSSSSVEHSLQKAANTVKNTVKKWFSSSKNTSTKATHNNNDRGPNDTGQGFDDSGVDTTPITSSSRKLPLSEDEKKYSAQLDILDTLINKILGMNYYGQTQRALEELKTLQTDINTLQMTPVPSPADSNFTQFTKQLGVLQNRFNQFNQQIENDITLTQEEFKQDMNTLRTTMSDLGTAPKKLEDRLQRIQKQYQDCHTITLCPSPAKNSDLRTNILTAITSLNEALTTQFERLNQIEQLPNVANNKLVFVWNNDMLSIRERKLVGGPKLEFLQIPNSTKGIYIESPSRDIMNRLLAYLSSDNSKANLEAVQLKDDISRLSTEPPKK